MTLTRIESELYNAAVEGDFNKFMNMQNMDLLQLLTPNKNTILHIHLTSTSSKTARPIIDIPRPFIFQLLTKLINLITAKTEMTSTPAVSERFVEQILDKCGSLALFQNSKGETPLHVAARYGHAAIAKLLLLRAKRVNAGAERELSRARTRENDETAILLAVRYNHIKAVEILLVADPEALNIANKAKETPLFLASERKYSEIVSKMLEYVDSPAYEGPKNRTALHAAVINEDLEMTKDHLKNEYLRAAVKHADEKHWVPLHYAAAIGSVYLTKLLLEQDENTAYMQDKEGKTPLHIAAYFGRSYIMEMIIRHYPDCSEVVDNKGWNALHYAVSGEQNSAITRIMRNLSLSNLFHEKDVDGNTPLHHLASLRVANKNLIFHGRVDKLALNNKDQTTLDIAYDTAQDADKPLRRQSLIWGLEKAGAKLSQRLDKRLEYGDTRLEFTKEAKESHLIVATLIATVTFAAAFTLPGGTQQDGSPTLGHKPSFKAFIISDTIALLLASSAVLLNLFSPMSKAKWLDYCLSEIAFSSTLVAIIAMIVAFATGTYTVFGSSAIGIVVVITVTWPFFLVIRQVLRMNFRGNSIIPFMGNLMNTVLFSFIRDRSFRPRRMDCNHYKAAIQGNFDAFNDVPNIENLLTPNNNTILHLHLTSTVTKQTQAVSQPLFSLLNKRSEKPISVDFVKKVLQRCGSRILIANTKGETLLHLAARYGHSGIAKLLIKESAKSVQDDIEAGRRQKTEIIPETELIRAKSKNGDTALHEAVRHNHIEIVDILLNHDASIINVANNDKETPLYMASEREYKKIVEKILAKEKSPAYEGPNDRTALHAAVINGDKGTASSSSPP
ncbi:hypothetical protein PIB30_028342 [Stylosanthes scabra]|uniref:PGG domain-containing protein n=1 Tax=Stylosanthes scabra TaxID=79078 RepID=A0ABU6QAF7_9FABA|nr:hypothetical protein [Stylosanthes scabra]